MAVNDDDDLKTRTVARAVGFLDSLGSYAALLLRRNAYVRVGVVLYFLFMHLWGVFVFYHFMHHSTAGGAAGRLGGLSPTPAPTVALVGGINAAAVG